MGLSQSDFQQHFSSLSDTALMEVHRDDLVEDAKAVYDREMAQRGLVAADAEEPKSAELSSGEELVNVVEFESADDAAHAQEKLKKNGIPAFIAVAVPAAFARQAVDLLDPGVSEEELTSLAESAAAPKR
jgi:hypothetical protein